MSMFERANPNRTGQLKQVVLPLPYSSMLLYKSLHISLNCSPISLPIPRSLLVIPVRISSCLKVTKTTTIITQGVQCQLVHWTTLVPGKPYDNSWLVNSGLNIISTYYIHVAQIFAVLNRCESFLQS